MPRILAGRGSKSLRACGALLALVSPGVHAGLVETPICGPLSGSLPASGSPYRATCSLDVALGQTLNVEAGVEIRFDTGTRLDVSGTLNAIGVVGTPITFASSTGTWGGVFSSGGTVQIARAVIEDAEAGVLYVNGASGGLLDVEFVSNDYPVGLSNSVPFLSGLSASGSLLAEAILLGDPSLSDTWSVPITLVDAGLPYAVLSGLQFPPGADLTVEPGVVIKAAGGSIVVDSTFSAQGTSPAPIVITSFLDDSVAGDTNADGAATAPGQDWGGVFMNGSSGNDLQHVDIAYSEVGLSLGGPWGGSVQDVHFDGVGFPVQVDVDVYPALGGLSATNSGTYEGIVLVGGSYTQGGTLAAAGLPYVVLSQMTLPAGETLTLEPGVVIKFAGLDSLFLLGPLNATGTAALPIVLTSLKDDSVAGDTNRDGAATQPGQDWNGLFMQTSSGNSLAHLEVAHSEVGLSLVEWEGSASNVTLRHVDFDVQLHESYPLFDSITVVDNTGFEGVRIEGMVWTTGGTFTSAGLPYVVLDDTEWLAGAPVVFEAGVVVKAASRLTFRGGLTLAGTPGEPVRFTSFTDDLLGDSNADGTASQPAAGDWAGILADSPLDGSHFHVAYALDGLELHADSMPVVESRIESAVFEHNGDGLVVSGDFVRVVAVDSLFADHDRAVEVAGGAAVVLGDLANADPTDDGRNAFACNAIDVESTTAAVAAENDWWGETPPSPAGFVGPVDYDPFLGDAPMPVFVDLRLKLVNGDADVELTWEDRLPACGYRVTRGTAPNGAFADVSGPLGASEFVDPGAGMSPGNLYYLVEPNP